MERAGVWTQGQEKKAVASQILFLDTDNRSSEVVYLAIDRDIFRPRKLPLNAGPVAVRRGSIEAVMNSPASRDGSEEVTGLEGEPWLFMHGQYKPITTPRKCLLHWKHSRCTETEA